VNELPDQPSRIRIAAMADLHVHKDRHAELRALFTDISQHADVLLLCGDLTNLGMPEEAQHLATDLATLRIPVLAVLGNHDYHSGRTEDLRAILRKSHVVFLDEDETFQLADVGFAGVKGFGGGFSAHMLSSFGEEATKHFVGEAVKESLALEHAMQRIDAPRIVVALHYSPVLQTAVGEPAEIFPFLGCSRLAETIDRFNVVAAFHGHAHRGSPTGRTPKGVPVYNVAMELMLKLHQRPYAVVEV
jgi:Icc-related predicted phosphoesterase